MIERKVQRDIVRILITGSRDMTDRALMEAALYLWTQEYQPHEIIFVHGACPTGADALANAILCEWGYGDSIEAHPAENFGRWPACGPRRNAHMVSLGAYACLAFPATDPRKRKGTVDCIDKIINAGIMIRVYPVRVP